MRPGEALATTEGLNWRKSPSDFGIGGRYPVKEVFAAAQATWRGECSLPSHVLLLRLIQKAGNKVTSSRELTCRVVPHQQCEESVRDTAHGLCAPYS